jgi:cell division transport system permease protein
MLDISRTDLRAELDPPMPRPLGGELPRFETPLVPRQTIAGRALMAVVAIMTFLASLTAGAVVLVGTSAGNWESDVIREVTIQVIPAANMDVEATVQKAAAIARGFPGIAAVHPYTKAESNKLLEPWLGTGLKLDDLPVPRLIVVKLAAGTTPNFAGLRQRLAQGAPGAMLDDHRGWMGRMRTMAGTAVGIGIGVLVLMIVATMLSVSFATRGAMASNKTVIEVLHFVGAKNAFIAQRFQRHFLKLGLRGGIVGGAAAMALFLLARFISGWLNGSAVGAETTALFGTFSIGIIGYLAIFALIGLIAGVTAWTSRQTVNRTLETID